MRLYRLLSTVLLCVIISSCATFSTQLTDNYQCKESINHRCVTAKIAKENAIYAMMSFNSYHDIKEVRFPLEKIGWNLIHSFDDPKSGLAYDIFEQENSNEVVFAFRGTESSLLDWFFTNLAIVSPQAEEAYKELEAYKDKCKKKNGGHLCEKHITLTGHSLGGGLAIGMSLRHGDDAVAFNSSPAVFAGWWGFDHALGYTKKANKRILIYQSGEILEFIRDLDVLDQFSQRLGKDNIYEATFDIGKHEMRPLAVGLLKLGKTNDNKEPLSIICAEIDCTTR